ncbi:MAG: hypothetical protein M3506_06085 [Chloroflexota bacterium]|nr:hypothetical protein [Chloroflexota bacterium]
MHETPEEIRIEEIVENSPDAGGFDRLGLDLTSVITSLQNSVNEMRQAAHAEITRMRAEHETERSRLEGQIEELQERCSAQDGRVQALKGKIDLVLHDYRGDLEMHLQRADAARSKLERVDEMVSSLESALVSGDGLVVPARQPQPGQPLRQRRGHVMDSWTGSDQQDTEEQTVAISSADESTDGTMKIAIKGVATVSAMMRARKAVESLPSIASIESRYVAEGTLFFNVQTGDEEQALADALAALPEPNLRVLQVVSGSIELEM